LYHRRLTRLIRLIVVKEEVIYQSVTMMICQIVATLVLQAAAFSSVLSRSDAFGMMSMTASSKPTTSSSLSRPTTQENGVYALNLKFTLKSERREEFLSLVKDNQKKTLDLEPAALQYVVGEDVDSPNTFYLHEEFIGSAGFDAHREMPHAATWAAFKDSNPFIEGGEPELDLYYEFKSKYDLDTPNQIPIRSAFCVHVELCIKPEIREEFLKVIENNQKGSTEDEPLCLQYAYGESASTANTFIFHEQYKGEDGGKEGFDAHTKAPHFGAWEEFVEKDPFTKPPVVNFFKTL
jgi:quinol monooxygenase YgiN